MNVSTPQVRASCERVCASGVKARTGTGPRSRDIRRAESPDWVKATTYFASTRSATSPAALAMTPDLVCGSQGSTRRVPTSSCSRACISVAWTMRAIVSTVWTGYSPTPVSPDSITASAPSRIALATSETSARVGVGLEIIDSSIWVATMTGLALSRALSMIFFWRNGTSSRRHLHAEVAAGHHEAVERRDHLVEVLDRLGLLDLGDDGQDDVLLAHDPPHVLDVRGAPHEAQRDEVDRQVQREAQVLDVLLRQRRHRDGDAGQVDALVVADLAADQHLADDVGAVLDLGRPAAGPCRRR